MRRSTLSLILMTAMMLVLGAMIVAQLRAAGRLHPLPGEGDDQAVLLSALADANSNLRAEVEALTTQEAAYEHDDGAAGLQELVTELNRVRVLNGLVEVSGPGLELLLDGPLNALDLQDMANELRNAGAEAMSLNDQRLVVSSVVVVDATGQIVLYGQPVSRPYRFLAIGDPETIETALRRPGGLLVLFRRTYPNLIVQTVQHPKVVMGVQRMQGDPQYAQPVE